MWRPVWLQVRDSAPSVVSITRCGAKCGATYKMLRPMWRQVRDVAPSMAPLTRLSAHHGAKYGSMCETMILIPENVGAKYGISHPMKHQSWRLIISPSMAPSARLCAKYRSKCETERQVWLQVRDFAPSMDPSVRLSAEYDTSCGDMVYLVVYPLWIQDRYQEPIMVTTVV
jgi:hypothetical protein